MPRHDTPDPSQAELLGFPIHADAENLTAREAPEILLSRFADEIRRGESPSIEDYVARYPAWAEQIRELFPLVMTLERWKLDKEVEYLKRTVPDEFPIRRLGGYQLIRELGRGGMGVVFEALQESSGKHFAVKLLPWRFTADRPQWKERFHREASTIARLRHRNIVRVYAFGTHDGYCYYVMDVIAGVSCDKIVQRLQEAEEFPIFSAVSQQAVEVRGSHSPPSAPALRPIPAVNPSQLLRTIHREAWTTFASIAAQVATALAHAHAHGVLHNDIKPANLLLKTDGQVIVTDFAIGRRTEQDVEGQQEHTMGTLRFMAPERLRGQCDARSDVYAIGATLYELATRTPAFHSPDRQQLVQMILEAKPRPPRQIVPTLPRPLETIILNAMAGEPTDRYSSAEALAADLHRFQNGQPIQNLRPGLVRQTLRRVWPKPK